MRRPILPLLVVSLGVLPPQLVGAQPLTKEAINVDAGNTKTIGATFAYRLSYNCSNISNPCPGASVIDLLPAEPLPHPSSAATTPSTPTLRSVAVSRRASFSRPTRST